MGGMQSESLHQLAVSAASRFHERYGRPPKWLVAAPGRVNIIGEHVDYNDGFVLPMAIDRYCVLAADVATGGSPVATVYSAATNEEAVISLTSPQRHATPGHWSNYFAGVIAGYNTHNQRPPAFVAVAESNVPVGGGLSSSAAIEVA